MRKNPIKYVMDLVCKHGIRGHIHCMESAPKPAPKPKRKRRSRAKKKD